MKRVASVKLVASMKRVNLTIVGVNIVAAFNVVPCGMSAHGAPGIDA